MERVHLRARLTDQKMLMIGGGSGGWGDKWPHLWETAILILSLGTELFLQFFTVVVCFGPTLFSTDYSHTVLTNC